MAEEAHHHHQQASEYHNFDMSSSLFELHGGMEMLGIPWKNFVPKNVDDYPDLNSSWERQHPDRILLDDPSLRCFFPCDQGKIIGDYKLHDDRGLSLSLPALQNCGQKEISTMDSKFYQTYQLKSSGYLIPAQELLNEMCSLGDQSNSSPRKQKSMSKEERESTSFSPPFWSQSAMFPMDILELRKRKAKLFSMLEEVDRRYKRYCGQMRAVVSSFEAVADLGSATVYSMLASKAISRHFRTLRDAIVSQVQAITKAMGEDLMASGTTQGETPRLKLLYQCLRQQTSIQQYSGLMESRPWRPQRGLPENSVTILRAWLFDHFLHPYPNHMDKRILARETGLSRSQVSNWFINARVRLWKPMVEEMYLEQTEEAQGSQSIQNPNPNNACATQEDQDQKPRITNHIHADSDSLTCIFSGYSNNQYPREVPRLENLGVVDLDFSSCSECNNSNARSFSNGVSLSLGLQQQNGGGISLPFSPTAQQSVFFLREEMEEGQNLLAYRDLLGARTLHDLAL